MSMQTQLIKNVLIAFGIGATACGSIGSAWGQPIMTWSSVQVNSEYSVIIDTANPDILQNYTGAMLELSSAGTAQYAYSDGSGGYRIKTVTNDVYAKASLATGELKTKAYLEFGTSYGATIPLGQSNGNSSAYIQFADSFRTYSGNTPYLWSDGTTVNFDFSITGDTSIPSGLAAPTGYGAGQPKNKISTLMGIAIYQPGALDLIDQWNNFDFSAYPDFATGLVSWQALQDQVNAMYIDGNYWFLGDQFFFDSGSIDPSHLVAADPNNPAQISFEFMPDGDFDWTMYLSSSVQLDASMDNISALLDFSHTVMTGYVGPDGTTTYSASGLFPETLALSTLESTVPEPSSIALLGLGLVGLAASRRRMSRGQ